MPAHTTGDIVFSAGETLMFLFVGNLDFLCAYRPGMLVDEIGNATIAPRHTASKRGTETGNVHVAHTHTHKVALHKTAKQTSVTFV